MLHTVYRYTNKRKEYAQKCQWYVCSVDSLFEIDWKEKNPDHVVFQSNKRELYRRCFNKRELYRRCFFNSLGQRCPKRNQNRTWPERKRKKEEKKKKRKEKRTKRTERNKNMKRNGGPISLPPTPPPPPLPPEYDAPKSTQTLASEDKNTQRSITAGRKSHKKNAQEK